VVDAVAAQRNSRPSPPPRHCVRCTGSEPARPTGSHVSPRLCSMPISAAFSIWAGVPPIVAARPAAAIEHADPTSPWQPTSAPEIDAFALNSMPMAPAVRRNVTMPSSSASASGMKRGSSGRRSDRGSRDRYLRVRAARHRTSHARRRWPRAIRTTPPESWPRRRGPRSWQVRARTARPRASDRRYASWTARYLSRTDRRR
jgi:hypothetical protein